MCGVTSARGWFATSADSSVGGSSASTSSVANASSPCRARSAAPSRPRARPGRCSPGGPRGREPPGRPGRRTPWSARSTACAGSGGWTAAASSTGVAWPVTPSGRSETNGSHTCTGKPSAAARLATSRPIRPKPAMPTGSSPAAGPARSRRRSSRWPHTTPGAGRQAAVVGIDGGDARRRRPRTGSSRRRCGSAMPSRAAASRSMLSMPMP